MLLLSITWDVTQLCPLLLQMSALPSAAEKKNTCIAVATLSSSVVFSALCSACAFLNSVTFIDSYRNELCEMEKLEKYTARAPF